MNLRKIKTIKKLLIIISILILSLHFVYAEPVLSISFTIDKQDKIEINEIKFIDSKPVQIHSSTSDYYLEFMDPQLNSVKKINFPVLFSIPGVGNINSAPIFMKLPFGEDIFNSKFMDIYHSSKLLKRIDLSEYICTIDETCNFNSGENEYNCPDDCIIDTKKDSCGDGICTDDENKNTCPSDCLVIDKEKDPVIPEPKEKKSFIGKLIKLVIYLAIVVVIIFVVYRYLKKKNDQNQEGY